MGDGWSLRGTLRPVLPPPWPEPPLSACGPRSLCSEGPIWFTALLSHVEILCKFGSRALYFHFVPSLQTTSLVPIIGPGWLWCHRYCPGVGSMWGKVPTQSLLSPLHQEERKQTWCEVACKHLSWAFYLDSPELVKNPSQYSEWLGPGSSSHPNSLQNRTSWAFP